MLIEDDQTAVEFGHDKFPIREREREGGGSFVMTKLKLSLVMTSLQSEGWGGGVFVTLSKVHYSSPSYQVILIIMS